MSKKEILIKELLLDLSLDLEQYGILLDFLTRQNSLLKLRNTKELFKLNSNLLPLIENLNKRADRREKNLLLLGVEKNNSGMIRIFNILPNNIKHRALDDWKNLHDIILDCRTKNIDNGRILAQQRSIFEKLIDPEKEFLYKPNE
ncbi:flagellar export chaperone FlgN [Vibrio harveyi]|nr:flagellar export chaperone FlgN [Vibrio harveyi]